MALVPGAGEFFVKKAEEVYKGDDDSKPPSALREAGASLLIKAGAVLDPVGTFTALAKSVAKSMDEEKGPKK